MSNSALKNSVKSFWNAGSCGTSHTDKTKFSREYFQEIEDKRYLMEPEIFAFAQFTRFRGQKLLEVGVGAGTDFVNWVRAGTQAHGIDLTEEAIINTTGRLALEGLSAVELKIADCENLPYTDNSFDIVYSWGVIHHTPDTEKAFREIIRVCRPGGRGKIMVYHRRSVRAYYAWFRYAFLRLRPWKSVSWCLHHHIESKGTKAYTRSEVQKIFEGQPIKNLRIQTVLTYHDRSSQYAFMRLVKTAAAHLLGYNRAGWFMLIDFEKLTVKTENK